MINSYLKNYTKNKHVNQYNSLLYDLVIISVKGLREMYLPSRIEFAEKKKKVNDKIILTGINDRYTLINLIGLYKASVHGFNFGVDLKRILKKQIGKCDKYNGVGEIGLLLWAAALISPEDIDRILTKINFENNFSRFPDYRNKHSMELSWFLTGILLASTFNRNFKESVSLIHHDLYQAIRNNYSGNGIFRHQSDNGLTGKVRGNIASFADQVYPIYALTLYSQQKNNTEALLVAKECALKLCELQGKNGEWYWHYDAETGKIINKFPIYSVHQDAMAPIALYAIQRATNLNFEYNIFKGLDWLVKQKCVDSSMICHKENLIWRAVTPKKAERTVKTTLKHIGFFKKHSHGKVDLIEECCSYHLGWLLYAFSGRLKKIQNKFQLGESQDLKIYTFNTN